MTGAAAAIVVLLAAGALIAMCGRRPGVRMPTGATGADRGDVRARWALGRGVSSRPPALVAAQAACALLLGLTLLPPGRHAADDVLVVWTAGAAPSRWRQWLWPPRAVALPEAAAPADVERAPDLDTALRRHADARRLEVRGDGLPPRDQAVAARWPLQFIAAPVHGLVALQAPATVQVGSQWSLDGRAAAHAVRAELRDPGGVVVDAVPLADGRFRLSGVARAAGLLRFEVRLLDAAGAVVDTASVPLQARTGAALTVIVRAGAPDPELKYWRRWAVDAGLRLQLAVALGPAMDVRDGDASLTPAALAAADLVVVDARAWSQLSPAESAALRSAVQHGLGLLLRCSGPLAPQVAADWAAFGFTVQPVDDDAAPITLDARTGLHPTAGERIAYTAAPVRIGLDAGTVALLQSDAGDLLAAARDVGEGRVAIWRLQDSYRLQLAGEPARYGRLWSDTLAQITRAQPRPADSPAEPLPGDRWVGEPTVLCGLGAGAAVIDARGGPGTTLLVDASGCAADVPAVPGWQRVASGGTARPFFVRGADDAAGLRRARDREATLQLAAAPHDVGAEPHVAGTGPIGGGTSRLRDGTSRLMPRWPFGLAWLVVYAWILWRERRGG